MYGDRTGIDDITVTCGDYRLTVVSEMSETTLRFLREGGGGGLCLVFVQVGGGS